MRGDWDGLGADDRAGARRTTGAGDPRRPPEPTPAQRACWSAPGYDRFRDPEHQRWAQGHRSVESLREAGRRSYAKAVERLDGMARTIERGVAYRLANPTVGERAMLAELAKLGLAGTILAAPEPCVDDGWHGQLCKDQETPSPHPLGRAATLAASGPSWSRRGSTGLYGGG